MREVSARSPADLHATVPELLSHMLAAADDADWPDAFLGAAGAVQIIEDRLQGTAWLARRLLDHLGDGRSGSAGPVSGVGLRAARRGLDVATELTLMSPARKRLMRWCELLSALTGTIADLVVAPGEAVAEGLCPDLHRAVVRLRDDTGAHRLLTGAILRHPSCFGSFDQHPADVVELARRFAAGRPDRDRPVLVVGVRTSGSYLAPLAGAAVRRLGYRDVTVGTTRPGNALLPGQDAAVQRIRARRGLVLVLDDPPITGGSLAAVAQQAEREGFPAEAVIPLVATFDDSATVPAALAGYLCVLLPGRDWHVRDRLRPEALEPVVAETLRPGERLTRLTVGDQGPLSRWAHLGVRLTADIATGGRSRTSLMTAEWTGLGFFGRRSVTVATALGKLVPRIHAFADGIMLREQLPGEDASDEDDAPGRTVGAEDVAAYIATREEVLAVPTDRSRLLAGRQPVWEVAARILAPAFGRLGVALRPPLVEPMTKALLHARRPCVIDGRTTPDRWAADGHGGWVKTDFAEGACSHLDLASYDAAFDLARAAAAAPDDEEALLASYRDLSGSDVGPARWCLLKLVDAWDRERLGEDEAGAARRAKARAVQRFLASVYLSGLGSDARGEWCALDIDGVLETDVLGFPASSPQGMLALRALRAHGYRVLLATGRPLQDLQDRCAAYGLSGGVAEYGCVSYAARTGNVHIHVPPDAQAAGHDALVRRLAAEPQVRTDPLSRWSVRASVGDGSHRRALPSELVGTLVADHGIGQAYSVVPGDAQTDFVPRGATKALGVRALLQRLGAGTAVPVLAVGDGVADIPLLTWAEHGFAPRNAQPAVEAAGVPVLGHAYQAGLADAVARLVGHRPGGCDVCAPPRPDIETRALLALLAVPEAGRSGAPRRIADLAWRTLRLHSPGSRDPRW